MKMKRRFIVLLVVFVGVLSAALAFYYTVRNKNHETIGDLLINNKKITDAYVLFNDDEKYIEIPFLTVLENIGFSIHWKNSHFTEIEYQGKKYYFDLWAMYLHDADVPENGNLIIPAEGGHLYYKTVEKDIMLDISSVKYVLYNILGKNVIILPDYDRQTVAVISDSHQSD